MYSAELPPVQAEASGDSSFRRFEADLDRRVSRRTPLLNSVLSEMEETARELREELKVISGEGNSRLEPAHSLDLLQVLNGGLVVSLPI
jgi:hypothetical protein